MTEDEQIRLASIDRAIAISNGSMTVEQILEVAGKIYAFIVSNDKN